MPQRFLRPGIRNSARWNSVDFIEQSFYIRLLTLVDDYGRYDGRPSVLFGECFSVWNDLRPDQAVTMGQCTQMLLHLASPEVNLIELYVHEGKQVLQVTQWQERVRLGCKEKYPPRPKLQQVAASCSVLLPPSPPPPPSILAPAAVQRTAADGRESETELPPGFPRTKEEAIAQGQFVGCSQETTTKAYDKAVSRGGRDSRDVPIRNFRAYLATEVAYERDRAERDKRNGQKSNGTCQSHYSRNVGTFNEGREDDYANFGDKLE